MAVGAMAVGITTGSAIGIAGGSIATAGGLGGIVYCVVTASKEKRIFEQYQRKNLKMIILFELLYLETLITAVILRHTLLTSLLNYLKLLHIRYFMVKNY